MAEVEYGGIKVGGSKLLLIIPLIGTLGGGPVSYTHLRAHET